MKDNFSKQAGLYARYRPHYPAELFNFIFQHVTNKKAAWDCATGNGQTAGALAKAFEKVYGTDISQNQLDNAQQAPNIIYTVQPAEQTNFSDNIFDLVTVSQALHWLKFDDFYKEVKRVGKPGSWIAVWMYALLEISPAIDDLVHHHHYETLKSYWDYERKYVDELYRTIPFPFEEISTPVFEIRYQWSLAELEGYLLTWSALQKCITVNKYNPVDELMPQIRKHWQKEKMDVCFPLHLRMGRILK